MNLNRPYITQRGDFRGREIMRKIAHDQSEFGFRKA